MIERLIHVVVAVVVFLTSCLGYLIADFATGRTFGGGDLFMWATENAVLAAMWFRVGVEAGRGIDHHREIERHGHPSTV